MLRDLITPGVRILFVGINPGMRSEALNHHFAGYSNRFWTLLYQSRIIPEPIGAEDDDRLPEWGLGITNLVARATPGIDSLLPEEYIAGAHALRRKVKRYKPPIVALVGVTVFRSLFAVRAGVRVTLGFQRVDFEGSRVFVLPNPSGRNANFTHAEMLAAFRSLRRYAGVVRPPRYGVAGCTRVHNSLNAVLSKNAKALTILPSRMVRNHA